MIWEKGTRKITILCVEVTASFQWEMAAEQESVRSKRVSHPGAWGKNTEGDRENRKFKFTMDHIFKYFLLLGEFLSLFMYLLFACFNALGIHLTLLLNGTSAMFKTFLMCVCNSNAAIKLI